MPPTLVVALLILALYAPAAARAAGPSGEDIVEAVCGDCHVTGQDGAPRIGDRAAWSSLAARGLAGLTQSALAGFRGMPAHGDNASLSDAEIRRAIVYMVNRSGGRWVEPDEAPAGTGARSGEQVTKEHCALCHDSGFGGAPRTGDHAAWIPRLALGIDPAVRAVVRGHGGMPARGAHARPTDAEIRAAVIYMASPPRKRPGAPTRR